MKKNEIIEKIIEIQNQKKECFVEVARLEDLQKLTKNDLIVVYNASVQVQGF